MFAAHGADVDTAAGSMVRAGRLLRALPAPVRAASSRVAVTVHPWGTLTVTPGVAVPLTGRVLVRLSVHPPGQTVRNGLRRVATRWGGGRALLLLIVAYVLVLTPLPGGAAVVDVVVRVFALMHLVAVALVAARFVAQSGCRTLTVYLGEGGPLSACGCSSCSSAAWQADRVLRRLLVDLARLDGADPSAGSYRMVWRQVHGSVPTFTGCPNRGSVEPEGV